MIDESMTDWAIVVTNGLTLVGRLTGRRLSPVKQLWPISVVLPPPGPNQAPIVRQIDTSPGDVLAFASIHGVDIPDGALVIPLAHLSAEDRGNIVKALAAHEEEKRKMRAAASNLVIAGADMARQLNNTAAKLRVKQ